MTVKLSLIGALALSWSLIASSAVAAPGDRATTAPAAGAASAAAPATIVLEAHVGPPSSQTAMIGPVLRELAQRGFAAQPASILALLGDRAPRPSIVDRDRTAGDIHALAERGYDAFTRGEYKDAVATLSLAVDLIKRNPGLLVFDPGTSAASFHAFVGLALGQSKLGQAAESAETMTELIRTFRTQPVTRAAYGPQAEQFFLSVQKQTEAMGRGNLAITTESQAAVIFVNGEWRGTGHATLTQLLPGSYRVFIQVPGTTGRQYHVAVRADETSKLDVNCQADSRLTVSETWIGFELSSEADQAREPIYASALARRWEQDTIVVIDATRVRGAQALIGTMYGASGNVVRRALAVPRGDPMTLRSLARFLVDGTPSADLRIATAAGGQLDLRDGDATRRDDGTPVLAWSFVAGGALAIGAGIGLLVVDEDRGHTEHGTRTAYYRDTAPFGVAAGIAGVASVGVGLWLVRTGHRGSSPSTSIGSSHLLVGWTLQY